MGALARLPDEVLDEILSRINDARALGMCAQTCAALRVLCYEEALWKSVALNARRGTQQRSQDTTALSCDPVPSALSTGAYLAEDSTAQVRRPCEAQPLVRYRLPRVLYRRLWNCSFPTCTRSCSTENES